jgi:hypothetical protein
LVRASSNKPGCQQHSSPELVGSSVKGEVKGKRSCIGQVFI